MTIKDKITVLGAARGLPSDAYLARALNRHGVAGVADMQQCNRSTVHQVCAELHIRWIYLSVPPDGVIIVHSKPGAPYQTDGRLTKEDPAPTDAETGNSGKPPDSAPPDSARIGSIATRRGEADHRPAA